MKKLTLVLFLLTAYCSYAQDKETQAQATYMAAEDAYNSSNFQKAYDKLATTENTLGKSNAKIEYLKVKCLVELKRYTDAKSELSKYFDVAANNKGTEKYQEMMMLYGKIDDIAAETIAKEKADVHAKNRITQLVAEIDYTYKNGSAWWAPKVIRVDSTSLQGTKLHFFYSGKMSDDLKNGRYGRTVSVELDKLEDISIVANPNSEYKMVNIRHTGEFDPKALFTGMDEAYYNLLISKIKELATLVNANQ